MIDDNPNQSIAPTTDQSEGFLITNQHTVNKMFNIMTNKTRKKGSVIWVVMDRYRTTCLQVPGTGKAFGSHLKKFVETVATEVGGVVEALGDAMHYVACSPCNLPKEHPAYKADKAAPKLKLPRTF